MLAVGYMLHGCSRRFLSSTRACNKDVCDVVPEPSPRDDPRWVACHAQHVDTIEKADGEEEAGYRLMFFGDSITETWAGTDLCSPCERCQGVPAVFAKHYAKYNAGVMAVGGDQTAHLMWRLQHGEVPQKHKPKVAVLLIGTNDLGAAAWEATDVHTAEEATMRAVPGVTLRVLKTLHTMKDLLPDTHVILLALLPRGGNGPGARFFHWPSVFTQPFDMTNAHFRDYTRLDGKLHFLDCGERFLTPDHRAIDARLMPDALHPSPAGYELLAECLDPLITQLMQRPALKASAAEGGRSGGQGADAKEA